MTENINVDAILFAACDQFKCKQETRYYLNGVYVQKHPDGGAVMVATDGSRMLVAHDKDGKCEKPVIASIDCRNILPAKSKRDSAVRIALAIDSDGIASCGTFRSKESCLIDGTFPDWRLPVSPILEFLKKRFHGKPVYEPASFSAGYLAGFKKVTDILIAEKRSVGIRLISFTPADPALILIPDDSRVFGLLMPMRAPIESGLPQYMAAILEPAKVAAKKNKAAA